MSSLPILKFALFLAIGVIVFDSVLAQNSDNDFTDDQDSNQESDNDNEYVNDNNNDNYTDCDQDSDHDRMLDIYNAFNTAFLHPNNTAEAQRGNSSLFAKNVQGRMDLAGSFEGQQLNTEYIFGLFANIANNETFSLIPVPVSSQLRGFISRENIVATTALVTFRHIGSGVEIPLIIDTWFHVNRDGKIDQYETTFKRHGWFFDTLFDRVTPYLAASLNIPVEAINATNRESLFKRQISESVCSIHQEYCTGENQQYDTYGDCMTFFMSLPFGNSYDFGQNNTMCRMMHQELVSLRPSVHCSNIGPSGGSMCIDRNYTEVVEEELFRQPFIEEVCNKTA